MCFKMLNAVFALIHLAISSFSIQNSSRLNGNGSIKEDAKTTGVTLKRPSSAPPMACVQNQAITRPSITDRSRSQKQKITISIHNKLPARQTVSLPDCLSSAVEDEDLYQAVPSPTITNSVMQILNSALITQSLTVQNLQENLRRSQRAY